MTSLGCQGPSLIVRDGAYPNDTARQHRHHVQQTTPFDSKSGDRGSTVGIPRTLASPAARDQGTSSSSRGRRTCRWQVENSPFIWEREPRRVENRQTPTIRRDAPPTGSHTRVPASRKHPNADTYNPRPKRKSLETPNTSECIKRIRFVLGLAKGEPKTEA